MTIAVDFWGTLCREYRIGGSPTYEAVACMQRLQADGYTLIIIVDCHESSILTAVNWLLEYQIPFARIYQRIEQARCRIDTCVSIGEAGLGGYPSWEAIMTSLGYTRKS